MTTRRTTHELAQLLEETAQALRQMPDMLLSGILTQRARKKKPMADIAELVSMLPQLSKEEATRRLNELGQGQLVQLCKEMKVNVGSKRTKPSLVQQVLWQLFDAGDELERIRNFEEQSAKG